MSKKEPQESEFVHANESFEHNNVNLEQDLLQLIDGYLNKFSVMLEDALTKFCDSRGSYKSTEKTYSVREIRTTYERAYMPWKEEEDRLLEILFCEGLTTAGLSRVFKRNEGAITSRISKLELVEKYPNI